MDPFEFDESIRGGGFRAIAGVDEAGRGPLAGPVVAAAVILPENLRIEGIRDSKKIIEKKRENIFWEILLNAVDIGVGIVETEEIDRINILKATMLAMQNAINGLIKRADIILIDALSLPSIRTKQMPIIKGDEKSASIAAASIIAKVIRDGIMSRYHSIYPQYEFNLHKGYATKRHIEMIKRYGTCPIHRRTFQKVRDLTLF